MYVKMNTTATLVEQPTGQTEEARFNGNPGHWPRDLLEAYARYRGPYTIENAETLLEAGLFHVAESCDHAAKLADFVDHESKCPPARCNARQACIAPLQQWLIQGLHTAT
jgi:hypothetical protein